MKIHTRFWQSGARIHALSVPAPGKAAGKPFNLLRPRLEDPQGNRMCSAFEEAGHSAQRCRDEGRVEFIID